MKIVMVIIVKKKMMVVARMMVMMMVMMMARMHRHRVQNRTMLCYPEAFRRGGWW